MDFFKRTFLCLWLTTNSFSFVPPFQHHHVPLVSKMSNSDDDGGLDAMRRLLESAWDSESMGMVPTDPASAAQEAGGSLLTAKQRGVNLCMINLLLPTYDITLGPNLYDAVEAVTFCVALSKQLGGKASIVVRDNKTVHAVSRVLDAREKAAAPESAPTSSISEVYDDDDDEEESVEEEEDGMDDDEENSEARSQQSAATHDDDNDKNLSDAVTSRGTKGDSRIGDSTKSELDDFRKQLMADWDTGDDITDLPSAKEEPVIPSKEEAKSVLPQSTESKQPLERSYRLTSMFGDATFTSGPDMFDKVIQAVSVNAQPKGDEDTVIILSAASEEETIGIRALANKFSGSKTIVLVNCNLEPVPRELIKAETVYSLFPLIAKSKNSAGGNENSPKVVVLRRYPRDFEVYMDFGKGFELTERVATSQAGKRGPSLQWVADCLKKQMDARL